MAEKPYVRRLYRAECDCGTMSNYLNVKTDHGSAWLAQCDNNETQDSKQPFMNACDNVPKENVIHFGRCNSKTNMGNVIDKEEIIMNCLIPGSFLLKKLMGCDGCKCKPIVSECWSEVYDGLLINGVPILTEDSRLYCRNGGVITIVPYDREEQ